MLKHWRIQGGGGNRDMCPLLVQFLSFSCSFRQKSCQIIDFCPKFRSWRPRLGNPGSVTDDVMKILATSAALGMEWIINLCES